MLSNDTAYSGGVGLYRDGSERRNVRTADRARARARAGAGAGARARSVLACLPTGSLTHSLPDRILRPCWDSHTLCHAIALFPFLVSVSVRDACVTLRRVYVPWRCLIRPH